MVILTGSVEKSTGWQETLLYKFFKINELRNVLHILYIGFQEYMKYDLSVSYVLIFCIN